MWINLSAEETTDNLVDNPSFTTDTSGWELSDNNQNKVKRDPNTYSDSASKSIRFRYQDGSINQDIDISNVPGNHIVKEINMGYESIGCGNTGSQWCTAGADDTVTSTITLSSTDTIEAISNTSAIPYEDGWSSYSFTEEVTGTFNTDDLDVNLNIIGSDTGNSSNWYGPIIDNISLTFTIEEYIAPVVEPIIVEPVIEPLVVVEPVIEEIVVIEKIIVEEPMIGGLELSTEITLDLIQDVPTLPNIVDTVAEIPEIQPVAVIDISMPEISIDIPTPTEIPVDMSGTIEVEPIQEIQEITVEEPQQQPEMVESTNEGREIEQETEGQIETVEAGTTDERSNVREPEPKEENKGETKKSTADNSKSNSKTKDNVQADRPTNTVKKNTSRPKATIEVNTAKPKVIEQPPLPIAYLQILQDSISIVETISLEQEQIYGGEQEYNLNTSSITIAGLDNNSSRRWDNLQNERKRFKAPKYSRRSKKD